MNGLELLGILVILYSIAVIFIAFKKPEKIWKMKKVKMFRKVLGEKGTVIFFYIWALIFIVLGILALLK